MALMELCAQLEAEQTRIFEALPALKASFDKEAKAEFARLTERSVAIETQIGEIAATVAKTTDAQKAGFARLEKAINAKGTELAEYSKRIESEIPKPVADKIHAMFAALPPAKDGAPGVNGKDASLLTGFRGNWDSNTTYAAGEWFTFRGSSYLVLRACKGQIPAKVTQTGEDAYYACFAMSGAPGINTGGGSGDVSGPSASTDGAAVIFDGTTGKLLKNGVIIINPTTGAVSGFTTGTGLTLHGGGTLTGASGSLDLTPLSGKTGTVNYAALATTSTDGWVLANTTASTSAATVQISPRLRLRGTAWDTAASKTVDFFIENLPATAATPTGTLKFGYSLNGAAASYPMSLSSSGSLTGLTNLATSLVTFPNGSRISDVGDGQILFRRSDADFIRLSMGNAGAATTSSKLQKKVTAIADNTATAILTVTVPNANHAALVKLTLLTSNGGTDAFESSRTSTGEVVLARTAGVDTVAAASALVSQIATVSGGATHTTAVSVSAMTGAASATQTFTIQVTIDDSGNLGASQCVVLAEVLNAEVTGVTIA